MWNNGEQVQGYGKPPSEAALLQRAHRAQPFNHRVRVMIVLFFVLALPVFIFATTILPDNWQPWTAAGITKAAAAPSNTPSELPGSVFQTLNWKLGSANNGRVPVMKVWPDVIMFYSFIYVVSAVGVLGQCSDAVYRVLHSRPLQHKQWRWSRNQPVGTLLIAGALLFLCIIWTVYWGADHYFKNDPTLYWAEKLARTLGQLGNLLLGLALLPVSRNSVWCHVFGFPWEASIKFHVYLGYAFMWSVTLHMVAWWYVYAWGGKFDPRPYNITDGTPGTEHCMSDSCEPVCQTIGCGFRGNGFCNQSASSFPHDMLAVPMYYPNNRQANERNDFPSEPDANNWTIPLATIAWVFMVVCMGVLALNRFRRSNWELFWVAHHIGFPIILISVLYHAASSWYAAIGTRTNTHAYKVFLTRTRTHVCTSTTTATISGTTRVVCACTHRHTCA